jgi:tRNA(Ile)-lysidine synthase
MLHRLLDFIKKENLFLTKDKILVAVSGGVDSIVLCELFHQANIKFGIAHCNFKLRGKESDGDEIFVKALAKKYDVPFYSKSFDTALYSKENGISIQMAARDLRYSWFEEIRIKEKYQYIAVAHHQNDVVETVLMNLIKGTGIAGLHGILPKKDKIIRPLLFATKEEIEEFAEENKLKFREDSSNQSDKYLRNKIRHQIIPVMKEINPSLEKTFKENVERIKMVEQVYLSEIHELELNYISNQNGNIEIANFSTDKLFPPFLHEFLTRYSFNHDVINDIIKSSINPISGKHSYSSTHRIIIDRKELLLVDLKDQLHIDESFLIKRETDKFSAYYDSKYYKMHAGNYESAKDLKNDFMIGYLYLDEKNLQYPLTIRRWKPGDFFYPLGMKKKKKISDFLIDNKVPLNKKENTFVVVSGDDIVCVLGHRIDNRYRISAFTKKVLTIDYKEK